MLNRTVRVVVPFALFLAILFPATISGFRFAAEGGVNGGTAAAVGLLASPAGDAARNPDDGGIRGHFLHHHGIRADAAVLPHEDRTQHFRAGADDYIVKPFEESALKAKLEKLGVG